MFINRTSYRTKTAENIKKSRPTKLYEAIVGKNIPELSFINTKQDSEKYLDSMSEIEIRNLFDSLKEKYGRDIFGQGYLFRIIDKSEISDIDTLSEAEKKKGINKSKSTYVFYDKGDKDGNRWFLESPFYIDWSEENVRFLFANSGKKGEGMPVVRNPQFYFREGFCWTDVNSVYLTSRIKLKGVHDVLSMSLFSLLESIPNWMIVCVINSNFISEFVETFINSTSHFQINDARQLPIIIPTHKQLGEFEELFNNSYNIKKKQFSGELDKITADKELEAIQTILDKKVLELYDL